MHAFKTVVLRKYPFPVGKDALD